MRINGMHDLYLSLLLLRKHLILHVIRNAAKHENDICRK